jgi:hypothetical protein
MHPENPDPYTPALLDSGAHDLNCPKEQMSKLPGAGEDFVVEGCGQRAVYRCPLNDPAPKMYSVAPCQMLLVSKFAK